MPNLVDLPLAIFIAAIWPDYRVMSDPTADAPAAA